MAAAPGDGDELDAPAVGASLVAFVLVYFAVFGAGTTYILKLMSHAPHRGEAGLPQGPGSAPIRTAGVTPSAQIDPATARRAARRQLELSPLDPPPVDPDGGP